MGGRAALVVAAHEFVDPRFQQLRSPARDVDALGGVLGDEAVGGFAVETLVNESSSEVQRRLERFFSGRKADDLLLLYFSCHGVKDPSGRLYFVTTNTEFDLLRSTGISATFVSEQMEYSRSKRIVVLLDCCYSGAFLKGFRARGDESVAVEQLEGRGRAVITASRATEYAFEADQLSSANAQPSLFTGAIVEGLASGRADVNGDGLVTVDELYDYVYDAVRGKVAGQTPGRWIDVEGDLVVARNPSPPVAAATLPAEILRAVDSDMAMQRLGAAYELTTWYQSADEARQRAAAPVLERLRNDYDERIKAKVTATLATPPGPPPTVSGGGAGARSGAGPAVAEQTGTGIPPPAPPAPTSPAAGSLSGTMGPGRDGSGGRIGARSSPPPLEPTDAAAPTREPRAADPPAGNPPRLAGWLAGVGGLAVLVAPFPTYRDSSDGPQALADRPWYSFGAFILFAMAAAAAYWLLRTKRPPGAALAALAGLMPFAGGQLFFVLGEVTQDTSTYDPGPGWYLMLCGFGLLTVSGVASARWLRRHAKSSDPVLLAATAGRTAMAAAGLTVGLVVAYGWALVFDLVDSHTQIEPADYLIGRAGATLLVLIFAWPRIQRGHIGAQAIGGVFLLLAVLVAAFLLNGSIRGGGDWAFDIAFAVLAVGALVVPVVAVALAPRIVGAVLLAAWAAATATVVPTLLKGGSEAGVLGAATAGALVLSAVLAQRSRPAG